MLPRLPQRRRAEERDVVLHWRRALNRAETADAQAQVLLRMVDEPSNAPQAQSLSASERLKVLYEFEQHVKEDPAASAYWRVVEELQSIERQTRVVTTSEPKQPGTM